uniref:Uncharacterized protein n=1 Tax=Salix viminalis TaxID=40686 RepID=A0A6N2MHB9_SALVM
MRSNLNGKGQEDGKSLKEAGSRLADQTIKNDSRQHLRENHASLNHSSDVTVRQEKMIPCHHMYQSSSNDGDGIQRNLVTSMQIGISHLQRGRWLMELPVQLKGMQVSFQMELWKNHSITVFRIECLVFLGTALCATIVIAKAKVRFFTSLIANMWEDLYTVHLKIKSMSSVPRILILMVSQSKQMLVMSTESAIAGVVGKRQMGGIA